MATDERRRAETAAGPHLDASGAPGGVRLFSNAHMDERMTTDSVGQLHLTRWRFYARFGWKMEASISLSAAASNALMRVMLAAGAAAVEASSKKEGG